MKIEIIGLGHIGIVMLSSLSNKFRVFGIDKNLNRLKEINEGRKFFSEDYIFERLNKNKKRIVLSDVLAINSINEITVSFICVGTPFDKKKTSLSISGLESLIKDLAYRDKRCKSKKIYCVRSTVTPGTLTFLKKLYLSAGGSKTTSWYYFPEFLREGSAYLDFIKPNIYILGSDDFNDNEIILKLLPKCSNVIKMNLQDSEIIKLVFNSWHALKISFANEIGFVCKALGLNSTNVINAFLADKKLNISEKYLKPGFAFGGYCLPKDSMAIANITRSSGFDKSVINAAIEFNNSIVMRWYRYLKENISINDNVLFIGIAFKQGCGDIRESRYYELLNLLINSGLRISVYDPCSLDENPDLINKFNFVKFTNEFSKFNIIIKGYLFNDIEEKYNSLKKCRIIELSDPI